jgi:hypothetical protein
VCPGSEYSTYEKLLDAVGGRKVLEGTGLLDPTPTNTPKYDYASYATNLFRALCKGSARYMNLWQYHEIEQQKRR